MKNIKQYASIKTKDIADIMRFLHMTRTLSPIAYKRLHYYVVSLERMLEEALKTVREEVGSFSNSEARIHHN